MQERNPPVQLSDYLRILRKRWWLGILAVVASVAVAVLLLSRATPIYRAEAKLFVGQSQVTTTELTQGVQVSQLSQQLLKTYAEVISTTPITQRAQAASGIAAEALPGNVSADPILGTQLLRLTYHNADPDVAKRFVNAVAQVFIEEIKKPSINPRDQKGGKPAISVAVVEPALLPTKAVSPKPLQSLMLAAILGLMLGGGLIFLAETLDVTIRRREDVEERLGLPLIGTVPKLDTHGSVVYLEHDPQTAGGEAFRKVRTAIGSLAPDGPVQMILVASGAPGEGKTTTAVNLAAAYALSGLRTLLVEADLRRPTLHVLFGTNGTSGLTTAIIDDTGIEEAIKQTEVQNLFVMLAGEIPPNPVELLDSGGMVDLLARLRASFDVVIFDTPPIMPVADAVALAPQVDGVLLVAKAGATHRKLLADSVASVEKARGRLLGVVLNQIRAEDSQEYGYYSYRSADPDSDRDNDSAAARESLRADDVLRGTL